MSYMIREATKRRNPKRIVAIPGRDVVATAPDLATAKEAAEQCRRSDPDPSKVFGIFDRQGNGVWWCWTRKPTQANRRRWADPSWFVLEHWEVAPEDFSPETHSDLDLDFEVAKQAFHTKTEAVKAFRAVQPREGVWNQGVRLYRELPDDDEPVVLMER